MAELKINRKFAERYDRYREKEELQRLKDRYGDRGEEEDSESSSSESDSGDEPTLDPQLDKDFYRTLSLLKKKDPRIYQEDVSFYRATEPSTSSQNKATKEKPMFLKDYERKVILEKEGKYEDEESSDGEEGLIQDQRSRSPTYLEEQRQIKESFREFVQDSDSEEEEGTTANLLTRRVKTKKEQEEEDEEYISWLKGQKKLEEKEDLQEMSYLKEYWTSPALEEGEKFLRDYILNKEYVESESEEDEECPPALEEAPHVSDSEDEGELFLKKQEDFERKYNFRFEEPDSDLIKTFPRTIAQSVRSKDDRRKKKRDEIKERKKKEKDKKKEELKQLKNLKRKELQEKLQKLRELTGDQELGVTEEDLLEDFDPEKHDQIMQKCFGDEYYGVEEDQKPQFDDEEEELDEEWNWDNWTGAEADGEAAEENKREEGEEDLPYCDDPNFVMDADFDPQTSSAPSRKERKRLRLEREKEAKKRKKSVFAEAVSKQKPVFNPDEKTFQQYVDEYYKMDYEDIVDDLPCRFRYRQVLPCDFGLTTEEILSSDDKDLNRWCSLRKTCMYRSDKEDIYDQNIFSQKGQNMWKKQQILKSLSESADQSESTTSSKTKIGKKRRDKLKDQSEQVKQVLTSTAEEPEAAEDSAHIKPPPVESKSKAEAKKKPDVTEKAKSVKPPLPKACVGEKPQDKSAGGNVPAGKRDSAKSASLEATVNDLCLKDKKKKAKRKGGRLRSSKLLRLGGRDFSSQRLRAYGLNPKRLWHRQLGRERRKIMEKQNKKSKKED
ncbi:protein KRI1 homolog [Hyperolius riggenbachi]|uniref:protein KRI1 homolog n=1 Tax=Hyperolius riggenbachi TaxID=752182 RepID=UPI0035A2FF79